jgi:PAS domain S-box-containing protein
MIKILFDLSLKDWQAILLSALPALLNIFIFLYVISRFPENKTSKIFALFVLALIVFQISDTLLRMSNTRETAILWNCIFIIGVLFVTPFGMHFTLLYTGRKKYADSFIVQFLLYTPALIFLILTFLNKDTYDFSTDKFWGWVYQEDPSSIWAVEGYWIGLLGFSILFLLIQNCFRLKGKSDEQKQARMITIGFAIPLIQGIFTEVVLPTISTQHSIPLTSAFMTFFSVGTLIALKKYNLFNVTDTLKTRTILEAMTDILIVISADKKILFVNNEGEQILGIDQLRKSDLKIEEFFRHEGSSDKNFSENVLTPALNGKKIINFSTEIINAQGKHIPVLISASSYKVSAHESQVLLLIHDISELIQTEIQLAIREDQLKDKTEELNSFFYRTTHDLKGPVASIIGLTKITKKEHDTQIIDACLDKIETSANRLNNILLDFIKVMHVRERVPEITLIDFQKLTEGIVHSLKYSTGPDAVEFYISIDKGIKFHSDQSLLDSIIYNLTANGVNYRREIPGEKSFVDIRIKKSGNEIVLKISDNGTGIKKEDEGKIYNLFFRGDTKSSGTGLGLYIFKNAITKLNGRFELESEVGKGTTFTIWLPELKQ